MLTPRPPFRNNSLRDIRRVRNQFWSSFKHAITLDDDEEDYDRMMSGFSDLRNDHALLVVTAESQHLDTVPMAAKDR